MDRFIWAVVAGVIAISAIAVGSALFTRGAQAPPDLSTPEGVARAYLLFVYNRQADQAWDLLESPAAVELSGPRSTETNKESFWREVNNLSRDSNKRIRILHVTPTGETARVDIEVTRVAQGPIMLGGGASSRNLSLSLRRQGATWRIIAAPRLFELG